MKNDKRMSKNIQSYGIDFDDEASKLLEKALSSFDGIILGPLMQINERSISMTTIHNARNILL